MILYSTTHNNQEIQLPKCPSDEHVKKGYLHTHTSLRHKNNKILLSRTYTVGQNPRLF